jgi:hypothetical protein
MQHVVWPPIIRTSADPRTISGGSGRGAAAASACAIVPEPVVRRSAAILALVADPVVPEDPPGVLMWLQGWYTSLCDGDWEHGEGIRIGTLDNPGWQVRIPLTHTPWEGKLFERIKTERDDHDWIHAWVEDGFFNAACGPTNLNEALSLFRGWVQP